MYFKVSAGPIWHPKTPPASYGVIFISDKVDAFGYSGTTNHGWMIPIFSEWHSTNSCPVPVGK